MVVSAPEEVHLECDIDAGDPPATVTWYKDNKELRSGRKYDISFKDEIASLVIAKTDVKDGGWYRCEATNKMGHVGTECTVVVHSKCKLLPILTNHANVCMTVF